LRPGSCNFYSFSNLTLQTVDPTHPPRASYCLALPFLSPVPQDSSGFWPFALFALVPTPSSPNGHFSPGHTSNTPPAHFLRCTTDLRRGSPFSPLAFVFSTSAATPLHALEFPPPDDSSRSPSYRSALHPGTWPLFVGRGRRFSSRTAVSFFGFSFPGLASPSASSPIYRMLRSADHLGGSLRTSLPFLLLTLATVRFFLFPFLIFFSPAPDQ